MRRSKADETVNEGGYSGRREVYGYVHKGRKHPLHKPQRKANGSHETTPCCLSSGTMHVHKDGERWREKEGKEKKAGAGGKMYRKGEKQERRGWKPWKWRQNGTRIAEGWRDRLKSFLSLLIKFCFCTTINFRIMAYWIDLTINQFGKFDTWNLILESHYFNLLYYF